MSRAKSALKKFTFALALTGAVLALGSATGREQPEETLLRIGPAAAEAQGVKGGRAETRKKSGMCQQLRNMMKTASQKLGSGFFT